MYISIPNSQFISPPFTFDNHKFFFPQSPWVYFFSHIESCFFFLSFFLFKICFILFFNFTIFYWFCHISTWIRQVYTCSPSWTLLPLPFPYHPSGSSQCTSPKHPVLCIKPGLATYFMLWYKYTMEDYSAIKKNTFDSVLMRWMKLEPIIQSEVSQKEKHQYSIILTF